MQSNISLSRLTIIMLTSIGLTGCSTYKTKFKCQDARGLGCTMFHEVYNQIESGQIEEAYRDKKKCKGRGCFSKDKNHNLLRAAPSNEAQTYDIPLEEDESESENSLLF